MEKFYKTEEGKIVMHGIHEHSAGIQLINSCRNTIKFLISQGELKESEDTEYILKTLESGVERCKKSIDYIYSEFEKKHYGKID